MTVEWKKKVERKVSFMESGTGFRLTGERFFSDHHMLLLRRLQHAHASHIIMRKYHLAKDGLSNLDISGWPSPGTS